MERAIFIAKCTNAKHMHDDKIVEKLKGISGIIEASAIPDMKIKGTKYCIIARANVPSHRQLRAIFTKIAHEENLADVKQLTAKIPA